MTPKVILAPMEGVVDDLMRDILSSINDFDLLVTEFVRVVDMPLPDKVFYRLCPELANAGYTPSGTPVRVQLLGQDPDMLAINAHRAVELGSHGIDINFGCPAKLVNRSKGGAALLQYPEQIYKIVKAMREAVSPQHPVTAKVRLGYEDKSAYLEIADAVAQGGANEIAVHARSKVDGYKPPAYWEYIAHIRQRLSIPVIANGEIWSAEDAQRCIDVTGCDTVMIGRGAISLPNLAASIKTGEVPYSWEQTLQLMLNYSQRELSSRKSCYYPARIKQWFSYLNRQYPQADQLFRELRVFKDTDSIVQCLNQAMESLHTNNSPKNKY
ncbi:tRNA dihydrouridine(16) synthase DusC [Shewanella sp. NFH-SH190041]|uniref:tRNA dihydrouridine(16) synthase DusC n=1 Tax=Shewanella sp. NFH-SH190041 TaxID=2950245 RepID=UPI0021C3B342|nr:tRNA dihydrouridine(16) synthase DusC [Shewanella sp. NFH-SH190041]